MTTQHYAYRLIPPRPSFAADMSDAEQKIMGEHATYWMGYFDDGIVAVFGVVLMPDEGWGLAVVEAATEDDVHALAAGDPAVRSSLCTYEIGLMPDPAVRGR